MTSRTETMPAGGLSAVFSKLGLPPGSDGWVLVGALLAAAVFAAPSFHMLATTLWSTDEHSFGPLLLAAAAWFLWQDRHRTAALTSQPRIGLAYTFVGVAIVMALAGRWQGVRAADVLAAMLAVMALLTLYRGTPALRLNWVPLALLAFLIPLPTDVVAAITGPLKSAVSVVAAWVLHAVGYPVGRTGVILTVGQYQLLVADACAGLNSIITLEAIGLIYMKLVQSTSVVRNTMLAILLVPVSFVANVIRVIVLVLVTFHFGDEAGQGFIHSAAGIVLFVAATMLMIVVDTMLRAVGRVLSRLRARPAAPTRARTT